MALLDRLKRPKPPVAAPPAPKPRGESGRARTDGFIQVDEVNQALVGERGLLIFDEMFRTDADCRRALTMTGVPLAAGTWEVRPYGDENDPTTSEDEEVAEYVTWNLFEHMTPNLAGHIWELWRVTARSGFAPFEQIYGVAEWHGRPVLALKTLDLRLPKTIQRWEQDGPDLTAIEQYSQTGAMNHMPMRDLVYYRLGTEGDNWEGESLLRPAYKHWKYKSAIELVQAIGIEKTAVGIPTGYPPRSAGQDDLDAFEDFLSTVRANEASFFMAPGPRADHVKQDGGEGWFWEFVTPSQDQGSAAAVQAALDYHAGKIDACVIGEFMRLGQQGVGARATADVQQDPFLAYAETLAGVLIEQAINTQLIPRLVDLNFSTTRMPKLTCSLIDSTSLNELADYAQKLGAGGFLRAEPTLEAFFRAKADLPEADEEAIAQQADEAMKRAQEMAKLKQPAPGEKPGPGNKAKPGEKVDDKPPTKLDAPVGIAVKDRVRESHDDLSLGKAGTVTAEHVDDDGAWVYDVAWDDGTSSERARQSNLRRLDPPKTLARADRPLRAWEQTMSLDRIEQTIDDAQGRLEAQAGELTRALAVAMARGQTAKTTDLEAAIEESLQGLFLTGRATVVEELQRQELGDLGWMLDAGGPEEIPPAERKTLTQRAKAIAATIKAQVVAAVASIQIQRGSTEATVQASAEAAAMAALRGQAQVHASSVLNAGRTTQADASADEIVGSRYTSILDARRCSSCAAADDDVLRPLDDPVRLSRIPPNPGCQGGGRCRCLEAFALRSEEAPDA